MDIAIPLTPPLVVRFEGAPPAAARFFDSEYGHMRVAAGELDDPDVLIRFVDSLPQPRVWESFGPPMGYADDELVVVDPGGQARIVLSEDGRLRADIEYTMPLDTVRRRVVLACLALAALGRDSVVVHASATSDTAGSVLLLGDQGVGKTGLLIHLVDTGHTYVADDQLFLTRDARLIPLQGHLELRLDVLASHAELGRLAKSTGWRQARALRSTVRGLYRLVSGIGATATGRVARGLERIDGSLSDHCFFLDARQAFPATRQDAHEAPPRIYLLSRGAPDSVEPAPGEMLKRWLLEESTIAYGPLFELMTAAARISPRWRDALDAAVATQLSVVTDAASRLSATRVRIAPEAPVARFAAAIDDKSRRAQAPDGS